MQFIQESFPSSSAKRRKWRLTLEIPESASNLCPCHSFRVPHSQICGDRLGTHWEVMPRRYHGTVRWWSARVHSNQIWRRSSGTNLATSPHHQFSSAIHWLCAAYSHLQTAPIDGLSHRIWLDVAHDCHYSSSRLVPKDRLLNICDANNLFHALVYSA